MDTLELFKDITLTVAYLEPSNTIICNLQIECTFRVHRPPQRIFGLVVIDTNCPDKSFWPPELVVTTALWGQQDSD